MKESFSLKFYLKTSVKKDNKCKVYGRIIVNREKSEFSTNLFIEPENWDEKRQSPKNKDKKFDFSLTKIKGDLIRIKEKFEYEKRAYKAKDILNIYYGKDKVETYLIEYFDKEIIKRRSLPEEYSSNSSDAYELTKEYLEEFVKNAFNKEDILIQEVDYKFLNDFDYFLMTKKSAKHKGTIERNTVNKHHSRFRTILLKGIREGILQKNVYADFKLKNNKTSRTFLSQEELDKLTQHSLGGNQSLIKVRDIYLFSVYTALRFKDAMSLKVSDLIKDKEGGFFIQRNQSKTEEPVYIKLLKPALEIFMKYENEERQITGYVLPRISNQKLNVYLSTIAELVGIDKKITHHTARHTSATTILLENDVPIEYVSKWLGHSKLATTQIYARITNKALARIADKLDKSMKNTNQEIN